MNILTSKDVSYLSSLFWQQALYCLYDEQTEGTDGIDVNLRDEAERESHGSHMLSYPPSKHQNRLELLKLVAWSFSHLKMNFEDLFPNET